MEKKDEEKKSPIHFGDLPVSLRQKLLDLMHDRGLSGPELTITGLPTIRPKTSVPQADGAHEPVRRDRAPFAFRFRENYDCPGAGLCPLDHNHS